MKIKQIVFTLILSSLLMNVSAQDSTKWTVRLGANGTGTYDDGIWTFKENTGLGFQTFLFQNSWGISIEADYALSKHWITGLYTSLSITGFQLSIENPPAEKIVSKDPTSFIPVLIEEKYRFRPDKRFTPYIGIVGGIMFARNIELMIRPGGIAQAFAFKNSFIYGYVIGADFKLGASNLIAHCQIRGTQFGYTLKANEFVNEQTLLDQDFYANPNHITVGIGRRF